MKDHVGDAREVRGKHLVLRVGKQDSENGYVLRKQRWRFNGSNFVVIIIVVFVAQSVVVGVLSPSSSPSARLRLLLLVAVAVVVSEESENNVSLLEEGLGEPRALFTMTGVDSRSFRGMVSTGRYSFFDANETGTESTAAKK